MSYRQALTERLIQILFKLVRRAHSRQELAREFGVGAKTISRDLDALGLEYPITEEKRGREVFYQFADGFKFDFPRIEIEELAVPLLAQEAVANSGITAGDSFYAERSASLLDKIRGSLPRSVKEKTDALAVAYGSACVASKDFSSKAAIIERLASCAVKLKKAEIRYHGLHSNRPGSRVIAPYAVYFDPEGTNVKPPAFEALKRRLCIFSVDRILNFRETDESFVKMPDFKLKTYLSENCFNGIHGAPVTVRLKVKGITARIFDERQFHP